MQQQSDSPRDRPPKKHRGGGRGRGRGGGAPTASPRPVDLPLPEGGIHIDGSMLEGGGQILRNASALAAILGSPLKVDKIRAGRDKPGLRPQHLTGLQMIAELCGGDLQGGAVGSSCITLTPGRLACGRHDADTRTAGSCMLLAQSALPCLLYASASGGARGAGDDATAAAGPAAAAAAAPLPAAAAAAPPSKGPAAVPAPAAAGAAAAAAPPPAADAVEAAPAASAAAGTSPTAGPPAGAAAPSPAGPVDESAALGAAAAAGAASFLDLRGGTDAAMAPPAGYMQHVLLPVLRSRLGLRAAMRLERRGFFPKGQGHATLAVQPLPPGACLPPIELTERGDITNIEIRAFTAGRLVPTIGERLAAAAQKEVESRMPCAGVPRDTPLTVEVVAEPPERAFGDGCGVLVTARSTTGCVFGASGLGERGVTAETIGARAAGELMDVLESGACTDEWLQDQLVIFMALAKGRSRLLTAEPTLHTRTACMVAEALTGARCRVARQQHQAGGGGTGRWLIEVYGAAVPAPAPA